MTTPSPRIFVRELIETDAAALLSIYSDKEAMKFRQSAPITSLEEALQTIEKAQRDRLEKSAFRWAVIEKSSDTLLGTFVCIPKDATAIEIGYSLARSCWGKGYATELVAFMLDELSKQGYTHVQAWTAQENSASQRVLIKNNFVLTLADSDKLLFQKKWNPVLTDNIGILGCGWLGLPLAQHLISLGYTVKGSTTTAEKLNLLQQHQITPYHICLDTPNLDPSAVHSFLENCSTLIIAIPPRFKHALWAYDSQLERLLPYLRDSTVKRVIFMSSTSVYGCQSSLITEDTPTAPDTDSGKQIVAAENLFRSEKSWKTTLLRLGGLFGPQRHPVTFLCRKSVFENPDLSVNMVHQHDVIALTTELLSQTQDETVSTFNLVAPYHQTRKEFYSRAAQEIGLQLPPDTSTNWNLQKKVSGDRVMDKTSINYIF